MYQKQYAQVPAVPLLYNNSGQVIHIHLCLPRCSIISYWSKGVLYKCVITLLHFLFAASKDICGC